MSDPVREDPARHAGPTWRSRAATSLLVADATLAALGVTTALASLPVHGAAVLAMIALRALTGTLEATAAWLLVGGRPAGRPIARAAAAAAVTYATLGIGLRLSPTNLDPAFRAPAVVAYWVAALAVLVLVRRR